MSKSLTRKKILIIYTGGTIGMIHDHNTGSLKPFDFGKINEVLPELKKLNCKIDFHSFYPLVDSSDMKPESWIKLAGLIEKNYSSYNGFIILHGTDTMAYTASALSFMLQNLSKPVILTGSQLPVGEIRTDARRNIITSVQIASGDVIVPEVCIFFNSQLFRGNRAEKYTSSKFDAFQSINYPLLAETGVEIKFNHEFIRKSSSKKLLVNKKLSTAVALLKIFPGIHSDVIENIISSKNLKALVLETYGSGNAPKEKWFINILKKATENGIVIVNISQCSGGVVEMGKYENSRLLKEAGVASGGDMTTEAVITKLMCLTGKNLSVAQIKKQVEQPLAGEMNRE